MNEIQSDGDRRLESQDSEGGLVKFDCFVHDTVGCVIGGDQIDDSVCQGLADGANVRFAS